MAIIDRYVIRQVLMPFVIGLLVFTFLLIIPTMMEYAEGFVAKGVPAIVVLRLMGTLIPQGLALTIPMSLLLGLLVAFGRLSADREFVALQACGVSLVRLLRPVGLLSVVCWAATSYVFFVAMPAGNQTFRELTFNIVAASAEGEVRPRVFFTQFPNLMLYVREVPTSGGWNGVFMSEMRGSSQNIYLARRGRVVINRERRTVEMVLEDVEQHKSDPDGTYVTGRFENAVLSVDPQSVFPQGGPQKGDNEMTIAELRARVAENIKGGISTHNQLMAIHRKFSIPVACLVFGLIGLALGATNRRGGGLGSFVIGILVIFAYYVPLYLGPALAKGGYLQPWLAVWMPNMILGALGIMLFIWRDRVADQPIRLGVPRFLRRNQPARPKAAGETARSGMVSILDRYVAATYGQIVLLAGAALTGVFYISTFLDLSDKVFKGTATWTMLAQYFWYITPQYLYYVIPLSVLVAALVTIGVLTKNSELVVMKACGISLYRVALPIFACGVVAGGVLFLIDGTVLGSSNRRAAEIKLLMRGASPESLYTLTRQWVAGRDNRIYHFNFFDPRARQLTGLDIFEFGEGMANLTRRTFAERAIYLPSDGATSDTWRLEKSWTRQFDKSQGVPPFTATESEQKRIESASYFGTEQPDARFMTYAQLQLYTERLRSSGVDVLEQQVALARKISFPFITIIMTVIAVPFAVTTGRNGALAGIGVGIGLAITYRTADSLFGALGMGGMMAPALAAWAPNLLFGAGALYLLLTVKT